MTITRRNVLLGATAAAALAPIAARAQTSEVVIGIIYPFSGANAQQGVDAQKAYETALEIINKDYDFDLPLAKGEGLPGLGGAKIRLVFADHQSDPQKGRAETERLITQEKVSAVIGTYQSAVAVTVSQICERYQIPFISADNSSPSLHRRGLKFYFRAAPHDEMYSGAMFDFFDTMKKKGNKIETLALFHEDTIFGTDSANAQTKLAAERGYKIVADIKYRSNSPSLSAEVQQLKAANADVLMPSSYTTDGILLVKTMGELGYKPNAIVAQDAGFSEKALYDAVGDKLEAVISRGTFSLDLAAKRPMVGKINAMFKEKSGKDFNDLTSRQFMGLIIMADAISRAKSADGDKIREALAAFGAVVYLLIVRFAVRAKANAGMVQIFSTFGLAIVMRGLAQFFFTPDYRSVTHSWLGGKTISIGGIFLPQPQLVGALVSIAAFGALYFFINRTDFGRALEATREDAGAVALVGIDKNRVFALGWGLGAALVGLAGAIMAMFFYIYPDVGASFALIAYVTVALGGFGSVFGAFAGGIVVGLVEATTALILPPSLKSVGIYAVYLLVVFVRPRGLFGSM